MEHFSGFHSLKSVVIPGPCRPLWQSSNSIRSLPFLEVCTVVSASRRHDSWSVPRCLHVLECNHSCLGLDLLACNVLVFNSSNDGIKRGKKRAKLSNWPRRLLIIFDLFNKGSRGAAEFAIRSKSSNSSEVSKVSSIVASKNDFWFPNRYHPRTPFRVMERTTF